MSAAAAAACSTRAAFCCVTSSICVMAWSICPMPSLCSWLAAAMPAMSPATWHTECPMSAIILHQPSGMRSSGVTAVRCKT